MARRPFKMSVIRPEGTPRLNASRLALRPRASSSRFSRRPGWAIAGMCPFPTRVVVDALDAIVGMSMQAATGGAGMVETVLPPGITPAGEGQDEVSWSVLGHRYFLKAHGAACFCF